MKSTGNSGRTPIVSRTGSQQDLPTSSARTGAKAGAFDEALRPRAMPAGTADVPRPRDHAANVSIRGMRMNVARKVERPMMESGSQRGGTHELIGSNCQDAPGPSTSRSESAEITALRTLGTTRRIDRMEHGSGSSGQTPAVEYGGQFKWGEVEYDSDASARHHDQEASTDRSLQPWVPSVSSIDERVTFDAGRLSTEHASQPGSPLRSSGLPKVLVYADKQVRGVIDYDVTELSARETVLHRATLTTLFPLLRQFPLKSEIDFEAILAGQAWAPRDESLTPLEQQFVRGLLDEYHPEFLTISPLVDAQGQPIPVMVSPDCSLPPQVQWDCHNILQDYPAHLRWKHDTLRIKAITKKDVPSHERPLVGQEGVFATRRIKPNTFIGFFGGMVLEDKKDIMNDRTLRDEAGCSKYFGRIRGLPSATLQVMDMTMKLNTATRQENGITTISKDDPRINITMRDVALIRTTDGQPLTIACFLAKRMISPGEQLCYFYGERDDDETQKVEVEWRAKLEPGAEEEE